MTPLTSTVANQAVGLDVRRIREDFPALRLTINGRALVYLDNAATAQKPQGVLDALKKFYELECANVHRGLHWMSEEATRDYEGSREKVRQFVGASDSKEIIFVRGTTEAINLVAQCFVRPLLRSGDEILITAMEHHSNIVPWQMLCQATGAS
jgi:cysteine desulfurase/selenocysteine lyase